MPARITALFARTSVKLILVALALLTTGMIVQATDLVGGEEPSPSPTEAALAEATPSPTDEPTPTATPSPSPLPSESPRPEPKWIDPGGGGGTNVVQLVNLSDATYRARASVQLGRIGGHNVRPVNLAFARATCTDCQTLAVAFQVSIYRRGASEVTPQNAAVAVNAGCLRCVTAAWAVQYVIPVDDMSQIPPEVGRLTRAMDAALREIEGVRNNADVNVVAAIQRIQAVKADFKGFGQYLRESLDQRTESDSPSPSLTPPPESPTPTDAPATESPAATEPPASGAAESPTGWVVILA
jgi:putative peptide zinc metalloprotease protein